MTDYYPEAPKVPSREQIAEQLGVDVTDIPATVRILRVYTVTRDGREWIVCPSCGPLDGAVLKGHGPEHIITEGRA